MVFVLLCGTAYAGQATLTWNAPTTNADGTPISYFSGAYKIYYGTSSGNYTQTINHTNTNSVVTYQVTNLTDNQTYYFAVTAVNTLGNESGYSNEASKVAQPGTTTYTITATAGANGTISPSGTTTVNSGATRSYTITPNSGYQISGVTVDGTSVGAVSSYSFSNVTANHTISASFSIIPPSTYTLSVAKSGTGTGTVSSTPTGITCGSDCSEAYSSGTSVSLTAAASANSSFSGWSGACSGSGACSVSMSAARSVTAAFTLNTYTITATAGANGTISPSGTTTVNSGGSRSYTITANSGYQISGVTVDGTSVGAVGSYSFSNVTANHTISASFSAIAPTTYTITATAGANGTISPSGTTTVNSGGSRSYTITANSGYQISGVTVDGTSVGAVGSYSFTNVTANHTISASFSAIAPTTYTITATAGANGTISPSGTTTVNSGGSRSYTITANSGYQISGVTVDGTSVGAVSSYSFSNVTANHTISASFSANGSVEPMLNLITPNGGETIGAGSIYPVNWAATGAVSFKIKYSMDSGLNWTTLDQVDNINTYDWQVPAVTKNKKNCFIKITGYDSLGKRVITQKSAAPFVIETMKLTRPNGGETFETNLRYTIRWQTETTVPVSKVKIFLNVDGSGVTWQPITEINGNPGSYRWTPDVGKTKKKCLIKIVAYDADGKSVGQDVSDDYFVINKN